ncbi:MAG: hypothetical protein OEM59_16885 [Rhodospirillales bacterium]|nr:hypothetical protein [Rhodospirillales bacterium]
MNTRTFVPAVLSAVLLSTPVLAAGNYGNRLATNPYTQKAAAMTQAEKCTDLEKQFDAAIKTHETAAKVNEAKAMRTEGGKLCAGGKQAEGIVKLEQALKDLGVEVKS